TQVRLRFALGIHPLVELALGDRLLVPKSLRAFMLALRVFDAGLSRDHLRLGALDLGGVGRGIDRDEEVPAIYERAFGEVRRLYGARDARAHVHPLDRFETAGELVPEGHVALLDGGD